MENKPAEKKCYNSWSCIASVIIIVFVVVSVIYDMAVSKPEMRRNISEIKEEIQQINNKIDAQSTVIYVDTTAVEVK